MMNNKLNIFYYISLIFSLLLLVIGCNNDEQVGIPSDLTPLSINMRIEGSESVSTRFVRTDIDDEWSFTDFTVGDKMGLYASGGNWLEGNQSSPFDNQELIYDGDSRFNSPNGESAFSPSGMKGNEVYMYFPYCPEMNTTGFELRQQVDESIRCIDFLSASSITMEGVQGGTETALFGSFHHAFSELIIMRGEGFESPPESTANTDYSRITAVINSGVTHIKVNFSMENGWSCNPELIYDDENANYVTSLSEAKEWDAWKGGNYGITQLDPVGKEAWYVIVPTLSSNRSIVEYIELYNNDGQLLRVNSLKLSGGNTKYVDPGWRYPLEITMNELVPTVNPFPIKPWGETVDLTHERTRGINDITEFTKWVTDYNAYLADPDDQDKVQSLLAYGDMITDGDTQAVTWEFYILSDLDFTNYTTVNEIENNVIIPSLKNASLNGQKSAISGGKFLNYKIMGLKNTFVGSMENASLMNVDFVDPAIFYDDNNTSSVGVIVNSMVNSEVESCNISNGTLFNPAGPGGMVAGTINGGSITNCSVKARVLSVKSSAVNGIVGEAPTGDAILINNNIDIVN